MVRVSFTVVLLLLAGAAGAQSFRGMPDQQTVARKQDATAGGGSSTGASAPSLPQERNARFDALDLDGDGRVSLAEAAGHADVVVHFDRADANRDGRLTVAEFDNLGKPPKRRGKATARTARAQPSTAGTHSASNR